MKKLNEIWGHILIGSGIAIIIIGILSWLIRRDMYGIFAGCFIVILAIVLMYYRGVKDE